MTTTKFARLTRAQVVLAIHQLEQQLPSVKYGSARDKRLRHDRLELFAELQKRDDALIQRWDAGKRYGLADL